MNLTEMLSRVRSVVRDDAGTYITDDDITDALNEAQLDLVQRTRVLQKTATGTTSGATIALPADLVAIHDLYLGETDHVDPSVDDVTFYDYKDNGRSPEHTIGRVFGGSIELYPTPTTGTAYTLRYVYQPADLSAGADVSVLPQKLQSKMVAYARAKMKLKDEDQSAHDRYMGEYEQDLPASSLGQDVNYPSPMDLEMQEGPFDYALRS